MSSDSMPSFAIISCCSGWRALAQSRRTRSSVSSPESVVKSMQEIARSSHAACHSFFTVRRVTRVAARCSTALVLTRTSFTQSRLSGTPRLASSARPRKCASAVSAEESAASKLRLSIRSAPPALLFTMDMVKISFEEDASAPSEILSLCRGPFTDACCESAIALRIRPDSQRISAFPLL